jgi:hypothetical protein
MGDERDRDPKDEQEHEEASADRPPQLPDPADESALGDTDQLSDAPSPPAQTGR